MVYTYKKISIGLLQHVDYPTHIHGHWFNLFITRTSCDLVKTVYPSEDLSDHMTVVTDVGVKLFFHASKNTDVLKAYTSYRFYFRYQFPSI